jgi:hypothetical protein
MAPDPKQEKPPVQSDGKVEDADKSEKSWFQKLTTHGTMLLALSGFGTALTMTGCGPSSPTGDPAAAVQKADETPPKFSTINEGAPIALNGVTQEIKVREDLRDALNKGGIAINNFAGGINGTDAEPKAWLRDHPDKAVALDGELVALAAALERAKALPSFKEAAPKLDEIARAVQVARDSLSPGGLASQWEGEDSDDTLGYKALVNLHNLGGEFDKALDWDIARMQPIINVMHAADMLPLMDKADTSLGACLQGYQFDNAEWFKKNPAQVEELKKHLKDLETVAGVTADKPFFSSIKAQLSNLSSTLHDVSQTLETPDAIAKNWTKDGSGKSAGQLYAQEARDLLKALTIDFQRELQGFGIAKGTNQLTGGTGVMDDPTGQKPPTGVAQNSPGGTQPGAQGTPTQGVASATSSGPSPLWYWYWSTRPGGYYGFGPSYPVYNHYSYSSPDRLTSHTTYHSYQSSRTASTTASTGKTGFGSRVADSTSHSGGIGGAHPSGSSHPSSGFSAGKPGSSVGHPSGTSGSTRGGFGGIGIGHSGS